MCVQKHMQTTDINGAGYRFFIISLCSENVGLMHSAWKGSIVYKIYILFLDAIFILTHISIIPHYNQQDAMFLNLFISTDALHVSGGSSAHHQEHKNCTYSFRYCQPILLLACYR